MSTDSPTLYDLVTRATARALGVVSVAMTARVDGYDRVAQTADVTPIVKVPVDDAGALRWEALPALSGVRVAWPSGGGVSLAWDLASGDLVTLLVRDRCHDDVDAGTVTPPVTPASTRRFSLSDAVVLPGYRTDDDPLPAAAVAQDAAVLRLPNGYEFRIGSATANKALALAELVNARIDALQQAHDTHKHPTAGVGPPSVPDTIVGPLASVASDRAFVDG